MTVISLDRVLLAEQRLRDLGYGKSQANFTGILALKRNGVNDSGMTTVSLTAIYDYCVDLARVSDGVQNYWYNPLLRNPWAQSNWPRGTLASAMERNAQGGKGPLLHSGGGENHQWKFKPDYIEQIAKSLGSAKIPFRELAVWRNRARSLSVDSPAEVDALARAELKLTDEEADQWFDMTASDEDDSFLTEEEYSDVDLFNVLPKPHDAKGDEQRPEEPSGGDDGGADEEEVPSPSPPPDADLVKAIHKSIREDAHFDAPEGLVRDFLDALRTDRFAVLVGKSGTGKTEFVKAFYEGLKKALAGIVEVHLIEQEINEDFAEHDLLGYRDLNGQYVQSDVIRGLTQGDPDRDLYIVLLDEFNLSTPDLYSLSLLAAVRNNIAVSLPGALPPEMSKPWRPPVGMSIVATMNSYLEDATRKPLSGPVSRRGTQIDMPNRIEELVLQATGEELRKEQFRQLCELVLVQKRERLERLGGSILQHGFDEKLSSGLPHEITDVLFELCNSVATRPEVALTVGPIQDVGVALVTSTYADRMMALDGLVAHKLCPLLRGPTEILDKFDQALPSQGFERTRAVLAELRGLAQENVGRIRPRF